MAWLELNLAISMPASPKILFTCARVARASATESVESRMSSTRVEWKMVSTALGAKSACSGGFYHMIALLQEPVDVGLKGARPSGLLPPVSRALPGLRTSASSGPLPRRRLIAARTRRPIGG